METIGNLVYELAKICSFFVAKWRLGWLEHNYIGDGGHVRLRSRGGYW